MLAIASRRWTFPLFAALMLILPALPVPDFWITQSCYIGLYALVRGRSRAVDVLSRPSVCA